MWCTWDYDAINLFYRIDTALFREVEHNPMKFLHSLSKERLDELAEDKGFIFEFEKVWDKFQHYLKFAGTFKSECSGQCDIDNDDTIAYFSMEFGLHECIPTSAGGLGVLAGDYLKGASDLGLPVVGVGLLYKHGYFIQRVDLNGYQQEVYTKFENHPIPIRELHDADGTCAHINVRIVDEDVKVKLWRIDVGKSQLILLDTNVEENPSHLRNITNELYVSDTDHRIRQELVLGIGGVKALELLGITPKIYHFNEGHSAFAVVGRMQKLMKDKGFSFSAAKAIIRASTVFTTHTPVIAGNEHVETEMLKKYLEPHVKECGLSFDEVVSYGYVDGNEKMFWLSAFAIRFSSHVNAVSMQHADVSRKMWCGLYPERPIAEVPIRHVTNGVHTSWISQPFTDMFNRYLGPDYIHCGKRQEVWDKIYRIPDEELWEAHRRNKKDLVNFIRRRFAKQMVAGGYSQARLLSGKKVLNSEYLTIVFARRFAAYKRPTLILKDKERLRRILTNEYRPVQLIFAGKAHPADTQSKEMIKEVIDFARQYNVEDRVIFLENYDINVARHLNWGADIWLNHPVQRMEASGTSGMKAAMNGVLHLSTLEGWWMEAYNGRNGWAVTAGSLYNRGDLKDSADANELYNLIEHEIGEMYYNRNESDIPEMWVRMMKESTHSVCQDFNMNRMICDYLNYAYVPSKRQSESMAMDDYGRLKQAVDEETKVLENWQDVALKTFSISAENKDQFSEGESIEVNCEVDFGKAPPESFKVELYYVFGEDDYRVLPMEVTEKQNGFKSYKCPLRIEGYGSQSLNARVKPANGIVEDIHPELVKWKD
jgi:starch phosphorylase